MHKLFIAAAGAALFAAAPSYAATTIIPQDNAAPGPILDFTGGTATATFTASYMVDNTSFTDSFFFRLDQAAMLTAGQLTTNAGGNSAPFRGDLDINVVDLLSGASTVFSFTKSTSPSGTDKNETFTVPASFLNQTFAAGAYSLRLSGFADNVGTGNDVGTYNGSLTFASVTNSAVPEPTTWAMMLVGFGAVGYSMRRRPNAKPQLA